MIIKISASTERSRRGQVYTLRISTLTDRDVIYTTPGGQVHRQWKVR